MASLATTSTAPTPLSSGQFRALVALFAISGAAALVDQVCFSKYLSYVVGSTAYAVSAVLAAFMTGLALGAHIGGRLAARVRKSLVVYGIVEVAVCLGVALSPAAFAALTPLYVDVARGTESLVALSLARWLLAMGVVMVPTTAMGMTLPLVSPALAELTSLRTRERRLGALYAANTVGGATGALAGAYVVLPILGLSTTLYVSAAVSAGVGLAAIGLGKQSRPDAPTPQETKAAPEPTQGDAPTTASPAPLVVLTAVAFGSGALVFVAEIVATHLLAVIIGNSAYAFGLILAVFLLCLFAGAALAPRLQARLGDTALPTSLAASALALAVTLPLWDDLPFVFGGLGQYVTSFEGREAMRAIAAFGILALPVTLMGLTFPLLLQRVARERDVGRLVGRLTAVNTLGAVVGSLAAGYWLLGALGSQGTFIVVVCAFAIGAVFTLPRPVVSASGRVPLVSAVLGALIALLSPSWSLESLTAGTNVYFDGGGEPDAVLFVREDVHGGMTTVTKRDEVFTLYTNGKFQGNTGWEMNAQRYFAHYPCLFVNDFDRALVIGMGTGTTLGTLAGYPWKRMDVVEISPSIIEAAHTYFSSVNLGAIDDPRVKLNVDDARNWLLVHEDQFDLISMELSSIWFAGASSLYSSEFYALVKPHLKPKGVFQQWVQLHHVYPDVFARILNTLRRHFEHVALFYGGGQGILVASDAELSWSRPRAVAMGALPTIADRLPDGRALESLSNDILVFDAGLDAFLAEQAASAGVELGALVSTDDNLFLEYATPRGNVLPWEARERLVGHLRTFRDAAAIDALASDR